jgi:hypothetical protein
LAALYPEQASAAARPPLEKDINKLAEEFELRLGWASQERPLMLFLDSLDQLSDAHRGRNLAWLPTELPAHCRLVVSTLPEEGGCFHALQQRLPSEAVFVHVPTLTLEHAREILSEWCQQHKRKLTEPQLNCILDNFKACPLPLWLKLAFDKSKRWRSWTDPADIQLASDVPGLIASIFERLERAHGQVLVRQALGYLTAAKHGVTGAQMSDLLSLDDEVLDDVYQWW